MKELFDKGTFSGVNNTAQRSKRPTVRGPISTLPIISTQKLPRFDEPAAPAAETQKSTAVGTVRKPAASAASTAASGVAPKPDLGQTVLFEPPEEDAEARLRYESALQAAEALAAQAPQYDSRYDAQIQSLYEQIVGREPFRYDSATDPLYQQYAQDYTMRGKLAMRDTMGQAAALTGGYGSSYAQSVGEQRYDSYLRRLGEILPQTYSLALEAYEAEGEGLQRRLQTAEELEKSDYARYLDELGQHNRTLDRADRAAENAFDQMVSGEERAYRRATDDYARRVEAEATSYARRQEYFKRLVSLISVGYVPTADDYALSGMSKAQANALRAKYLASARSSRGSAKKSKEEKSDSGAAFKLKKELSGDTKNPR